MPGVRVKEGESFENAMKRFKKQCEKAGILSEIRKREHYEKPSVKRKRGVLFRTGKELRDRVNRGGKHSESAPAPAKSETGTA